MTAEENRRAALALIRGIIGDATVMVESVDRLEGKSAAAEAPLQQAKPAAPAAEPLSKAPLPADRPADDPKANSQSEVMALLKKPVKR